MPRERQQGPLNISLIKMRMEVSGAWPERVRFLQPWTRGGQGRNQRTRVWQRQDAVSGRHRHGEESHFLLTTEGSWKDLKAGDDLI